MEINKYFKCLCPNKFVAYCFLFVVLLDSSYILDKIDEGYLQSMLFDDKMGENVCICVDFTNLAQRNSIEEHEGDSFV
jgi:hypothetical protein